MDSSGNMYGNPEAKAAILKILGEKTAAAAEQLKPIEQKPDDAIEIKSEMIAAQLATMNRRQRLAFFSERRHGVEEDDAIEIARNALR